MFKKAVRRKARLRLALVGPPGSGKTKTAIKIAMALLPKRPDDADPDDPRYRLAVICSEHGSAELYQDDTNEDGGTLDFDLVKLHEWRDKFSVENYQKALDGAAEAGYPIVLVDSLSHAWAGQGGLLEFVDRETEKSRSKSSFSVGWRKATPLHNHLVDALLSYPGHLLATLRSKMAYVIDEKTKRPEKIGLQPVQREGVEYEFTAVGDIDMDHNLHISKSRCSLIADRTYPKAGKGFADEILEWLEAGANWHDDQWERSKPRFFMALAEIAKESGAKVDYDTAAELLESYRPGFRPSQINNDGRKELLDRLGNEHPAERVPGEEG